MGRRKRDLTMSEEEREQEGVWRALIREYRDVSDNFDRRIAPYQDAIREAQNKLDRLFTMNAEASAKIAEYEAKIEALNKRRKLREDMAKAPVRLPKTESKLSKFARLSRELAELEKDLRKEGLTDD